MKPTIDEVLARSNPWPMSSDARLRESTQGLVEDAQAHEARKRFHRPLLSKLWLIPSIGLGGLALTAGALVVDNALFPDLPLAIDYVTDTGVAVSCTAQIMGGSIFTPAAAEVVNYFQDRDVSGYGQKIYEHALVLTGDAVATAENTPASSSWVPGEGNWLDDKLAFNQSLVDYLIINTQIELNLSGNDGSLTSDCTGKLH